MSAGSIPQYSICSIKLLTFLASSSIGWSRYSSASCARVFTLNRILSCEQSNRFPSGLKTRLKIRHHRSNCLSSFPLTFSLVRHCIILPISIVTFLFSCFRFNAAILLLLSFSLCCLILFIKILFNFIQSFIADIWGPNSVRMH